MKRTLLTGLFCLVLSVAAFSQYTLYLYKSSFFPGDKICANEQLSQNISIWGRIDPATDTNQMVTITIAQTGKPDSTYTVKCNEFGNFDADIIRQIYPGNSLIDITAKTSVNGTQYTANQSLQFEYGPNKCATVTGKLFTDKDGNCANNAGDVPYANKKIYYYSNTFSGFDGETITNAQGEYSLKLPKGAANRISVAELYPNGNGTYNKLGCGKELYQNYFFSADTTINFAYKDTTARSKTQFYVGAYGDKKCVAPALLNFSQDANSNVDEYGVHIDFGDGTDTSFNGDGCCFSLGHTYYTEGAYHPLVTYTLEDTIIYYQIPEVYITSNCGNVSGLVYRDENGNCTYDQGTDLPLKNQTLVCKQGSTTFYHTTDSTGFYSFQIPVGANYEIHLADVDANGNMKYFNFGLQACMIKYQKNTIETGLDFGLKCSPITKDFEARCYGGPFRPGFTAYIYPHVINRSCVKSSGTVQLTLDSDETYVSANPAPSTVNGQTLTWNLNNIGGESEFTAEVKVTVSQSAQIGDSVCHLVKALPTSGDADVNNNTLNACMVIRGAYDPNIKLSFSAKTGEEVVYIPRTDNRLTYELHFQNTGTDTAFNIFLLDTISANMNLESFHIESSSHPVRFSISDNRIIRFEFKNILLPDDKTNEPKSHGRVTYSITPNANLAPGTHIYNLAAIYFDYNDPILTNKTDNIVWAPESVSEVVANPAFSLYPNPVKSSLNVKFAEGQQSGTIVICDVLGKVISRQAAIGFESFSVEHLEAGVYTFSLSNGSGSFTSKFVVSR